ncbi:hypothetical protein D0817_03505 [Flavobacterium cupreum]|uniref:Uncharacterized protein n=1 Tax=Flavobacterium cupreum TaxID=2133766 RepID=A0A434ABP5_9FLAO|nr:hypothetical protein D0817_03505 [Flavobacterium cupreum]
MPFFNRKGAKVYAKFAKFTNDKLCELCVFYFIALLAVKFFTYDIFCKNIRLIYILLIQTKH